MLRITNIPVLSPNEFSIDNSVLYLGIPQPCHLDWHSGKVIIDKGYSIVGYCAKMHDWLMHNRSGQIGIMLLGADGNEVWQHYPYYEDLEFIQKDIS